MRTCSQEHHNQSSLKNLHGSCVVTYKLLSFFGAQEASFVSHSAMAWFREFMGKHAEEIAQRSREAAASAGAARLRAAADDETHPFWLKTHRPLPKGVAGSRQEAYQLLSRHWKDIAEALYGTCEGFTRTTLLAEFQKRAWGSLRDAMPRSSDQESSRQFFDDTLRQWLRDAATRFSFVDETIKERLRSPATLSSSVAEQQAEGNLTEAAGGSSRWRPGPALVPEAPRASAAAPLLVASGPGALNHAPLLCTAGVLRIADESSSDGSPVVKRARREE